MVVKNRGVSPVIATVLLIFLVLVLVSIIFSFARGFVDKSSKSIEFSASELCSSLDFGVTVFDKDGEKYYFEAINYGNVDVASLRFKVYSGGNSDIIEKDMEILVGGSISDSIVIGGTFDEVEVLGVLDAELVGKSEDFVCTNHPVFAKGF